VVKSATILIIDDEESLCDSCSQVYVKDGYSVDIAMDGITGLQKVKGINPDIVLVDLKMPGMSGMEVLEEIKKIDPEIISIVITGYATIDSAVEAMKRGAYDFLPKPFTPDQLRVITERALGKRASLIEIHRLEKMREGFISMVSHQLKTPLVAVQEYFEVILGGMAGKVTKEQREMLGRSKTRIDDLLKLIKDWLNLSRIDENKIFDKLETISLLPILTKTEELIEELAKQKNITLRMDIPKDLPMVLGDEESLEQLFLNLMENSINYNKEGGNVTLRAAKENDYVIVEITDTGIGIPKDKLPFIFEQFYRIKGKKTQVVGSTGLGLSIVKKIVDAHSGVIKVTSKPGKGSTFKVFLPREKKGR
jgi:signal transduction histidine kinase